VPGSLINTTSNVIPELQQDDADVSLLFLSANEIAYLAPVEDKWFSAHQKTQRAGVPDDFYYRDEPAAPLACATQYQWCKPGKTGKGHNNVHCTSLTGLHESLDQARTLWQSQGSSGTLALLNLFINASEYTGRTVSDVVTVGGPLALLAHYTLDSLAGVQVHLPDDQWQLEVSDWFNTILALVQRWTVDVVVGYTDPALKDFIVRPSSEDQRRGCRSQVC
jgi:hypothetical protein